MQFYAHSREGVPPGSGWEELRAHLEGVADRAAEFSSAFSSAEWGRLTGLWHDLGKYSKEFQEYLLKENGFEAHLEHYAGRVDHSTAGAQHAVRALSYIGQPEVGRLLAYCIAGHHAGLADAEVTTGASGLDQRLRKELRDWSSAPEDVCRALRLPEPSLSLAHDNEKRAAYQISLFCRMLFSCLVDADFLATEEFMSPDKARLRPQDSAAWEKLEELLLAHLKQLASEAKRNDVFSCRQEVLAACQAAATRATGLFSLTVPTGGGKTLASLAFALRHARKHGLRRIIYTIPFTSIIEQTANEFRAVFKATREGVVLEHHTNLDPQDETPLSRLATENWDAPVVVTTNVQFFESFFASRTSKCRKLHRIARSVIVLDEAQTLPVQLMEPCLAVLRELAADYGCSIILCTATQPAIVKRDSFSIGLDSVREIMPYPPALYRRMKRVAVKSIGRLADGELVDRLSGRDQYLCIVNTRPHASRIFERLQKESQPEEKDSLFCLSTLLCGKHRSEVIETIRGRLKAGQPCRVISTQLIEAGVDVDFPSVFRALSGVDSIAQAAGRCNREGRTPSADVYVFEPADVRLHGYLKSVADSAAEFSDVGDLLDLDVVQRYFELHLWKHSDQWDKKRIMNCFNSPMEQFFQFRTASRLFRMIEDKSVAVVVPWGDEGKALVERIRAHEPDRTLKRSLQRYTVSLFEDVYQQLLGSDIELLHNGYPVLINPACYDDKLGLRIDLAGYREPEALII